MYITLDIVEFYNEEKAPMFDLIIGTETMQRLGIILDFKTKVITIDKIILPMRKLKSLRSRNVLTTIYGHTEPIATLHETERMVTILDTKYEKADLLKVGSENCDHLNSDQQEDLLALLGKYNELFDGTLGDWMI